MMDADIRQCTEPLAGVTSLATATSSHVLTMGIAGPHRGAVQRSTRSAAIEGLYLLILQVDIAFDENGELEWFCDL